MRLVALSEAQLGGDSEAFDGISDFKDNMPLPTDYDCIGPLNKKETNLIHLVSDAVRVVQELNMDNVRALADTYHMEMEGESPEVLADLGAFLSHVHVADTDRRALVPGITITISSANAWKPAATPEASPLSANGRISKQKLL